VKFQVTFPDGRTLEVAGDEVEVGPSGETVIWREVFVANTPRRIVARRFDARDQITVEGLAPRA
jgi:hypothetical protein